MDQSVFLKSIEVTQLPTTPAYHPPTIIPCRSKRQKTHLQHQENNGTPAWLAGRFFHSVVISRSPHQKERSCAAEQWSPPREKPLAGSARSARPSLGFPRWPPAPAPTAPLRATGISAARAARPHTIAPGTASVKPGERGTASPVESR